MWPFIGHYVWAFQGTVNVAVLVDSKSGILLYIKSYLIKGQ